jgi:hypothetical protein
LTDIVAEMRVEFPRKISSPRPHPKKPTQSVFFDTYNSNLQGKTTVAAPGKSTNPCWQEVQASDREAAYR